MGFTPDYQLNIISEAEFAVQMSEISQRLAACCTEGYFDSFDGKPLYYETFSADNSIGSIVIVHGCSEFTKKFYEIVYYFLNQGYNVFLYDQRGHGHSFRMAEPVQLVHVDKFQDYVEDLACFIRQVVLPAEQRPLCLYSHSMGGAVSALLLAQYDFPIKRAVFSAPMIHPVVKQVPEWLAWISVQIAGRLIGWDKKIWIAGEFDPNREHRPDRDPSKSRYLYNIAMRREDVYYQSTPLSLGWNREVLKLYKTLLQEASKITVPSLVLSAEKDQVVRNDYQEQFVRNHPDCKMVTIPDATHAMLAGTEETIRTHMELTLDFFAQP